jgi:hypothetical protein
MWTTNSLGERVTVSQLSLNSHTILHITKFHQISHVLIIGLVKSNSDNHVDWHRKIDLLIWELAGVKNSFRNWFLSIEETLG